MEVPTLARNRDEESDELDLEDFDDDEEYEDYEDDETEDEGEEDDLFENPVYKEIYTRAKTDAELAVIEAITSEDTDTPVYKGLQKVVSKKDQTIKQQQQELQELRQALSGVYSEVSNTSKASKSQSKEFEALKSVFEDMLEDEDSKKVFRNRMNQATASNEVDDMKQQIAMLTQALQGRGNQRQQETVDDEPEEHKVYKTQFQENLESLAEEAGVNPKDKRLNYGDWNESFLERTIKLNKSIKAVKADKDDEQIDRATRKVKPPRTRTEGSGGGNQALGKSLLEIGAADMAKKMRKVAFG